MSDRDASHKALIQGLKLGSGILEDFLAGIPEAALHRKRREDFWSLYEHVEHLAITQLMLYKRLERFVKEEHPEFVPYFPDEKEEKREKKIKPVAEILSSYRRWRDKQVQLIEKADSALWEKTATHPEYEQYGFKILVRHILLHDSFHLYRMEELWLSRDEYLTEL
ncbi:MAG: DinB family protein [Spirochaetaceae bacterium]|nr:MAG: DinB family protein [Spirochaetaceae bacterium]